MSSGRLLIVHRCFILRVLEVCVHVQWEAPYWTVLLYIRVLVVVCACLVGGSLLYIAALFCDC